MALILESDKDADSILRFGLICDEMGGGVCLVDWQPVSSPTRVLVFRPPSSTQSSADEFIDVRAVVAIVLDVEAAEVVLKDVVGHGVAIIVEPCWASLLPVLFMVPLRRMMHQRLIRLQTPQRTSDRLFRIPVSTMLVDERYCDDACGCDERCPSMDVKSTFESRAIVVNHGEEAGVEELLLSAHINAATEDGEAEARILSPLEVSETTISSETGGSTMEPEADSGGHYVTTVHAEDENGKAPVGVLMAVLAGTLYGIQFAPLKKWNNKVIKNGNIFGHDLPSDTTRALRFFFSQFAGIFMMATAGFILYCAINKNKPQLVPPEATLPSIICGATWAVGCSAPMLATSELGNTVGFPLVLNFSFLVNSAWSILVFEEIQGRRDLQFFGGAFFLNVMSSLFISISK